MSYCDRHGCLSLACMQLCFSCVAFLCCCARVCVCVCVCMSVCVCVCGCVCVCKPRNSSLVFLAQGRRVSACFFFSNLAIFFSCTEAEISNMVVKSRIQQRTSPSRIYPISCFTSEVAGLQNNK